MSDLRDMVGYTNMSEIARTVTRANLNGGRRSIGGFIDDGINQAWVTMLEVSDAGHYIPSLGSASGYLSRSAYLAVKRARVKEVALVNISESKARGIRMIPERSGGGGARRLNVQTLASKPEDSVWDTEVREALSDEFCDLPLATARAGMEVLMGSPTHDVASAHNLEAKVVYRITARMRLRIKRSKRLAQLAADFIPSAK